MKPTLEVHQVHVTASMGMGKWPWTGDTNFEPLRVTRLWGVWELEDRRVRIINTTLPIMMAYRAIGYRQKPPASLEINNLMLPPQAVIDEEVRLLREVSVGMDAVYWNHANQCFPPVAEKLPELFKARVLIFSDDCPGSSEQKTFPVCRFFTDYMHSMEVWSFEGGQKVAEMYAARGLKDCHFVPNGRTGGLKAAMDDAGFDFAARAQRIEAGDYPEVDVVFVGLFGGHHTRRSLLRGLVLGSPSDVRVEAYGTGSPRGVLGDLYDPRGPGYVLFPLYNRALFGVNPQMSSLFNTRLMDLWYMGVAQLIYDPYGELAERGFQPEVHYIPFDGTIEDMASKVRAWKARPKLLGRMIRAAREASEEFLKGRETNTILARIYKKRLES